MTTKAIGGIVAAIIGFVAICAGGAMVLLGGAASACTMPMPSGTITVTGPAGGWRPIGRFDSEQVGNGRHHRVGRCADWRSRSAAGSSPWPPQYRNPTCATRPAATRTRSDCSSSGPAKAGAPRNNSTTPSTPAASSTRSSVTVPNWQSLPLTEAAQAVQHSAYPDAYAKHENDATLLVNTIAGLTGASATPVLDCAGAAGPWTQPVHAPIVSGFRTASRPTHDGVDLGSARGTPIHAASAGTVTVVRCNIDAGLTRLRRRRITNHTGLRMVRRHRARRRHRHPLLPHARPALRPTRTDRDDRAHHRHRRSSGHSSGPHLHFEVHLGDHSRTSAVDPVPFMAAHGVPLGDERSSSSY